MNQKPEMTTEKPTVMNRMASWICAGSFVKKANTKTVVKLLLLGFSCLCFCMTGCAAADTTEALARKFEQVWLTGGSTNSVSVDQFLAGLNKLEKVALAKNLGTNTNAAIAYFAANLLMNEGREKDGIAVVARLIANGQAERDLKGRVGYDWVHIKQEKEAARLLYSLAEQLVNDYPSFSQDAKQRAEKFICGLELCGSDRKFNLSKVRESLLERRKQISTQ